MIQTEHDALARIIASVPNAPAGVSAQIRDWDDMPANVRDMLSDNDDATGDGSTSDVSDVHAYAIRVESAIMDDDAWECLSDTTTYDNALAGAQYVSAYSMSLPHASYIIRLARV